MNFIKIKSRELLTFLTTQYFNLFSSKHILILINDKVDSPQIRLELEKRTTFYFNHIDYDLKFRSGNFFSILLLFFVPKIKLIYGYELTSNAVKFILKAFFFFNVDFNRNADDGWQWHFALTRYYYRNKALKREILSSFERLCDNVKLIGSFEKAYIFGTGPSLSNAINENWNDGYRIVCNTIVKDPVLWKHIEPHFIVAGDAIYHFAFNDFAVSFMNDLKQRMSESATFFVYPFHFHVFVKFFLNEFQNRLIPIPVVLRETVSKSLFSDFRIPTAIGNSLNMLLLPLACSLSKKVYLYGFDGRAPKDQLFWANSSKHSYEEKIKDIINNHPKFFDKHVPKNNEDKYVKDVHGNKLERILKEAESKGWEFKMMHSSWTETLNKRFNSLVEE
jgi:hypothetical protein